MVLIEEYSQRICYQSPEENDRCQMGWYDDVWVIFDDQLNANKTKGILLIILLFSILSSLLISIYTLIRWIIYTIQVRRKIKSTGEWSFTKIEERHQQDIMLDSPIDHYERLPLTKEEEEEEIDDEGEENQEDLSQKEDNDIEEPKVTKVEEGIGAPPKMTFYDEMIDLLKEKLDDPDNYATVADSTVTTEATNSASLYQDPVEAKKNNEK